MFSASAPGTRIIPARAGFTPPLGRGSALLRDHPRSRGVYVVIPSRVGGAEGSSPLARGLLDRLLRIRRTRRIIPARAGFTEGGGLGGVGERDHPRSRGVYSANSSPLPPRLGSSPLARGLPSRIPCFGYPKRIIPARAGFTFAFASAWHTSRDHPRSRGVYFDTFPVDLGFGGSSPLARGLLLPGRILRLMSGIIPARAGFTDGWGVDIACLSDHPRSRGVYSRPPSPRRTRSGSSPLARGLRPSRHAPPIVGRIIPARAGFTPGSCSVLVRAGDHPRSRGVYFAGRAAFRPRGRIIPARAGFTGVCISTRANRADHPRSRGVYTTSVYPAVYFVGSSPLARGLRSSVCPSVGGARIIPARAGFTQHSHTPLVASADHPRSRGVYYGLRGRA